MYDPKEKLKSVFTLEPSTDMPASRVAKPPKTLQSIIAITHIVTTTRLQILARSSVSPVSSNSLPVSR